MRNKIKYLIISVALIQALIAAGQTVNPSVLSSTGGLNETPTLLVSWTLGELVSGTASNSKVTLIQGFQPIDIDVFPSFIIPKYQGLIKAYPIPADNQVNIEFINKSEISYEVSVYSLMGQLLFNSLIYNELSTIDLSGFSSGQYILTVRGNSGETLMNCKIIKN